MDQQNQQQQAPAAEPPQPPAAEAQPAAAQPPAQQAPPAQQPAAPPAAQPPQQPPGAPAGWFRGFPLAVLGILGAIVALLLFDRFVLPKRVDARVDTSKLDDAAGKIETAAQKIERAASTLSTAATAVQKPAEQSPMPPETPGGVSVTVRLDGNQLEQALQRQLQAAAETAYNRMLQGVGHFPAESGTFRDEPACVRPGSPLGEQGTFAEVEQARAEADRAKAEADRAKAEADRARAEADRAQAAGEKRGAAWEPNAVQRPLPRCRCEVYPRAWR